MIACQHFIIMKHVMRNTFLSVSPFWIECDICNSWYCSSCENLNTVSLNQIFMYVYLVQSDICLFCSIRYLCMFILFNQIFMCVYLVQSDMFILFNQIFMYVYLVQSDISVCLSCSIRYFCMFILFNQIFLYVYLVQSDIYVCLSCCKM